MPEFESFDSNCITPGTEFMYHLGECYDYISICEFGNESMYAAHLMEVAFVYIISTNFRNTDPPINAVVCKH